MKNGTATRKKTTAPVEGPQQFIAKAKFIRYSPYKLRPIVDVVRGKNVDYALQWLTTYRTQRAQPVMKVLESAVANAKDLQSLKPSELVVKDIRVDGGPIQRYFKPGAQGRANPQRKRMCHIRVVLQTKV
jgi:large subunit ribosomal protein L22